MNELLASKKRNSERISNPVFIKKLNGLIKSYKAKYPRAGLERAVAFASHELNGFSKKEYVFAQNTALLVYRGKEKKLTERDKFRTCRWVPYTAAILFAFGFYFMGVAYTGYNIAMKSINYSSNIKFFLGLLVFVVGLILLGRKR